MPLPPFNYSTLGNNFTFYLLPIFVSTPNIYTALNEDHLCHN